MLPASLARPVVAVAVAALSLIAAAQTVGSFSLRQVFQVGETYKGKFVAVLDLGMAKVKVSANTKSKVDEVKPDGGYVTTSQQTNVEVYQGDNLVQQTPEGAVGKTTFAADGRAIAFDEAALEGQPESFSFSVSRAASFIAPANPVKQNDEWEVAYAADAAKDVPASKAKFKFVAVEKVGDTDTAMVEGSFKETVDEDAVSSDGKFWVNLATGEVLKSTVVIRNLMTPMGVRAKTAEITAEVVK